MSNNLRLLKLWIWILLIFFVFTYRNVLISYAISNFGWINLTRYIIQNREQLLSKINDEIVQEWSSLYTQSIDKYLNNFSAHRGFGWIAYQQGKYPEAIYHWKVGGLTDLDLVKQSDIALKINKTEKAKVGYQMATMIEPRSGDAWFSLGVLLLQENQLEEARFSLEKAINGSLLLVNESDVFYYLGETHYIETGTSGSIEALSAFDKALALANFSSAALEAETFYKRGVTKQRLGFPAEEVIPDFQTALEIVPTHTWAHIMLGNLLFDAYRDLSQAEQELYKAIELSPNDKWTYRYLGDIYLRAGNPTKAIEFFQRVLEIDPHDTQVRKQLDRLRNP